MMASKRRAEKRREGRLQARREAHAAREAAGPVGYYAVAVSSTVGAVDAAEAVRRCAEEATRVLGYKVAFMIAPQDGTPLTARIGAWILFDPSDPRNSVDTNRPHEAQTVASEDLPFPLQVGHFRRLEAGLYQIVGFSPDHLGVQPNPEDVAVDVPVAQVGNMDEDLGAELLP